MYYLPRFVPRLMLLIVVSSAPTLSAIEIETVNGAVLTARLELKTTPEPTFHHATGDILPRDVLRIVFAPPTARQPAFETELVDGTRILGPIKDADDADSVTIESALRTTPLVVPLESVRSIRAPATRGGEDQTLRGASAPPAADELRSKKGAVLNGVAIRVAADGVEFEDQQLGRLRFAWDEVEIVRFAALGTPAPTSASTVLVRLHTVYGSEVVGALDALDEKLARLTSPSLGSLEVPIRDLAELEFRHTRALSLSDLEPTKVEEGNPWTQPTTFERYFRWQKDRRLVPQVLGAAGAGASYLPLQIRGVQYRRGLGVHARSRLTFAIPTDAARFQTWIGIDDSGRPTDNNPDLGHVVFRILLDDKEVKSFSMNWQDQAVRVDIPLDGAKALTLVVEEGRGLHILDRANWADARFIRK
ncbi:MAG: NPCBM/NEW2 domain-containing protein [Planctomycetota bacterium]